MSRADELYRQTCLDILENGFSDEGLEVRPKWADGTPAHTIKKFGVVNRYNLAEEFPIMTLRRTYWKSAVDELLQSDSSQSSLSFISVIMAKQSRFRMTLPLCLEWTIPTE